MVTRFIRTVRTTQSEIKTHDSRVNTAVRQLTAGGGKIVSITHFPFGISPMYMICSIVYESDREITEDTSAETTQKAEKDVTDDGESGEEKQ